MERHPLSSGSELWVARREDPGPAGISLVFPGGAAAGVQDLARGIEADCAGSAPVLGAGPDYEILSLSRPPDAVAEVLACVGRLLDEGRRPAGASPPPWGPGPDAGTTFWSEVQATRSAAGVLLTTLYAPAPVPGGALEATGERSTAPLPSHLVVAGAVDARAVVRGAEAALAPRPVARSRGSASEGTDAGALPEPRPPVATEVLVLDRPGEALVDVRVGQLILPGDHPEWVALVAAREILAERLRGGPWAFAELLRVQGPGAFIAGGRLTFDALPGGLERLWSELEALGDRLVTPEELRGVTARLAGSFEVATAGAPGLADELARVAALGLGPEAVADYTARLAVLTPDAVRRAVRTHLDPARLVIAAAGDGSALSAELGRFGPVRRIGTPSPPVDWPLLSVDGTTLGSSVSRYRVRIGDREVGTARREVTPVGDDRVRLVSTARLGGEELRQEAEATLPELAFLQGSTMQGGRTTSSLRRDGDRLGGTAPGGVPVQLPIPPGTIVSDLLEPTLWASTLEVGGSYRVPVAAPDGAAVTWAAVQVLREEEVTGPEGPVRTLRVRVAGPELLTLWLRRDPPHRTVRLLGANGVTLELVEEDAGGR